jgi:hypothetical protein
MTYREEGAGVPAGKNSVYACSALLQVRLFVTSVTCDAATTGRWYLARVATSSVSLAGAVTRLVR